MSVVKVVTEVPGPKSKALAERRKAAVMPGVATGAPMFVTSGQGARVTDIDGNTFLDFASGIGVLAVGHAHPKVAAAIAEQAKAMTHMCFQVAGYESYVALCERVGKLAPIKGDKKTLLVSTGAEAVENAIKIARVATGRQAIIAFTHGYHGRTLLTMTLTGRVHPYKVGGAFAPEVYRLPFPYAYRGEGSVAFENVLKNTVAPDTVAAIILEPVLGEGGFLPAPVELVKNIRALCDKHGILLIADEIQTGFGRTGAMFASQLVGMEPDLMTFAKSVAGGMPLAGVIGKAAIVDKAPPGSLGGTYAGNPIACAAALATIDVIESEKLVERASVLGNTMRARFDGWAAKSPHVGDVRGLGAMLAIELVKDKATREPAPELATRVKQRCLEKGLIILGAGTYLNVIRILVPLTISEAELDEGLTILENALFDG